MHSSGVLLGQELLLAGHPHAPITTGSRVVYASRLESHLDHRDSQSLLTHKPAGVAWTLVVLSTLPAGARLRPLSLCPMLSACRLNAFNYNKLLPRTTTGAALMQNGSLMARFAAPTCWNLLHMVHMDGRLDDQGTTTVFTQVWARLAAQCR